MVGHIPSKCEQKEIVHKKKTCSNSVADTFCKEKSNNKTWTHKETSNNIKKRTSDDVIRSKKAVSVGYTKHTNKKIKKVSKRQKMQKRKLEETGQYIISYHTGVMLLFYKALIQITCVSCHWQTSHGSLFRDGDVVPHK